MAYRGPCYGSSEAALCSLYGVICAACAEYHIKEDSASGFPSIEGGPREVTSAGSDPFSDQSRHDMPSAFEKGKTACTSAICVSSVGYTCIMLEQQHTGVNPQTQMHGYTNTHTRTHTSSLFQGSFVKMTAGLLLRWSLPGRIPRLFSGSQNIQGNIVKHSQRL